MSVAIGSAVNTGSKTSATQTQSVKPVRDADGDNDGSKPGEVEKTASVQKPAALGNLGTIVNTKA